ncbi:MAG: 2-oxoacid:acceptor oxidoreductase family protein, partial [Candidatus Omnitrophota bacterium]
MTKKIEIRWHGRGGQGAVTAAKILAEAALSAGKYVQAFPEFGPERAGAPVKSFNRISDNPITAHSQITNPNIVVVLDETLLSMINVCDGIAEDGVLVINTRKSPSEVKKDICGGVKVAVVDATEIAMKEFGRNIPNTPMIAALAKATDVLKFDAVIDSLKSQFSKKFSADIVDQNLRAMKEAFEK